MCAEKYEPRRTVEQKLIGSLPLANAVALPVYVARLPPALLPIFASANLQRLERRECRQAPDLSFLARLQIAEPHHPVKRLLRAFTFFAFAPEYFARSIRRLDDLWRAIFCVSDGIEGCLGLCLFAGFICRGRRRRFLLRRCWRPR